MNPIDLPPFSTQVEDVRYCFLEFPRTNASRLDIAAIGRERCHPDYRVARSGYVGFAVEFVAAGRGKVVLDGKSWRLGPGTLFCYGPNTRHVITTDRQEVMTKFFVDFRGRDAAPALARSGLPPGRAAYTLEIESFRNLYEAMLAEGDKGLPASAEICVRYLQVLLLKAGEAIPSNTELPDRSASNFQRCRSFIDAHFSEVRDLDDMARALHLTPAYLCRLFQKFGHPGPFQYLTRKKLSRAAELLVGTGCAVKEAAAEVGYRDPYHFSRAFRRFFGMSPTIFVQNRRNAPPAVQPCRDV